MLALILSSILATPQQDVIETRALRLLQAPEIRHQVTLSRQRYLADPMAASPDGRRTLDAAVEELAWAAVLLGTNSDATHPAIGWVYTEPRQWRGRSLPGSRWAVDNPDNVYRIAPLDGTSHYEIDVRRHGAGPAQFSFLVYSHFMGEDGHDKEVDAPRGGLRDIEVKWRDDDSFTLTIDPDPANGRANHIQSTPDARQLLIRNTLADWSRNLPLEMHMRRVGGPAAGEPASDATLVRTSVKLLDAATGLSLNWKRKALFGQWADNALCEPYGRGKRWGFASSGNFKLGEDEALVVTIDPLDAQYIGFELTDLWLASLEHIHRSGSLNGTQAQRNADGSYTYVISPVDPGVHNWLDTGGLREGSMLVRWQVLPESRTSASGAVRSVRLVKRSELDAVLPQGTRRVTPEERRVLLEQRARDYARRYTSD